MKANARILHCGYCEHEWARRNLKTLPAACPRCHSPNWNKPARCCPHCGKPLQGSIWNGAKEDSTPVEHEIYQDALATARAALKARWPDAKPPVKKAAVKKAAKKPAKKKAKKDPYDDPPEWGQPASDGEYKRFDPMKNE